MGDVDVGRGGPTVDWHDASLDLCPCPRASSMARGHVQEDELDRGNGVPRGMQRRCERAWPRSWCSAETIPFSIATAEAGFCELDGQRSSPRKGAHRLLGLLAMIKSRASTHSCFPVFGFLAMIKSRVSTHSCSRLAGLGHRRRLAELGPDGCRELSSARRTRHALPTTQACRSPSSRQSPRCDSGWASSGPPRWAGLARAATCAHSSSSGCIM